MRWRLLVFVKQSVGKQCAVSVESDRLFSAFAIGGELCE